MLLIGKSAKTTYWKTAMKKKVITISANGYGAGKSLVGVMISDYLSAKGYTVDIIPFASPLKEHCMNAGIISRNWNIHKSVKERVEMQSESDRLKENDQHAILKMWIAEFEKSEADFVIVDDMRFPYEYSYACRLNAFTIRVEAKWACVTAHESDTSLPSGEYVFDELLYLKEKNTDELREKVNDIMAGYTSKHHIGPKS
jgi:hypothetical protein